MYELEVNATKKRLDNVKPDPKKVTAIKFNGSPKKQAAKRLKRHPNTVQDNLLVRN